MIAYEGVLLTRSAAQEIPDSTETLLSFDTETHDTNDFYDSASPTQIVVPVGLNVVYHISASVQWAADATGIRWIGINAGGYERTRTTDPAVGGNSMTQNVSTTFHLEEEDIVTLTVYQSSGGALDVERTAYTPRFGLDLIGTSDADPVM